MTSTLDPQPTASTSTSTALHRTPSRAQTGMINTATARRPTSTLFNRFKRASSSSVGPDDLVKRVGIWTEDADGNGEGGRSKDKESMSEASLVDREWEEVDWERVKTLPMVCLIPPEEDEVGPVTLYPLLPPLPPPPTAHAGQGPTSVWGGMANGFVRPPPVFSRTSPAPGRAMYGGGGRGVVMPKTKNEVVAARSRRLAREMIDGPSTSRRPVSMIQPDGLAESTSEAMGMPSVGSGDRSEGAMEMLSTDDKVVPGEDRLPPLSPEDRSSDNSDRPSVDRTENQVGLEITLPPTEPSDTRSTAQIQIDNEESTLSDNDEPPVQPILASRVPIPPPPPPTETTIDPPIIASRSSEPDQAPSTDKRRRRTFSLTSLLASKSHKTETPTPPVPPLPSTQAVEKEERGRPRVRKQKSLKQMFFPSDEPLPPVPALPIMRRSESETVSSNRNLDPSPVLRDSAAAEPPYNAVQTELCVLDNERTPRPVSVGPASPAAQPGPSRMIKRFSLSNMSGAFKKMAAVPSSKKDVPPVPFLPEGYRQTPDREYEVTPRQPGSTRGEIEEEADRGRTRTRTESGFSTSTSTETESPTCHTLTSVSPRTQRDPSASPALRDHIHRVSCSSEVKVENTHHRYQSLEATIFLGSSPFPHNITAVEDEEPSRGRMDRDDSIDSIPSQSDTYESNGVSSEDHQLKTPIPSGSMTMDEIRGPMPTIELDRQESRYEDAQDHDQIAGPSRSGYSSDSFQSFHSAEQGISISPSKPEPTSTPSAASARDRVSMRRLINPRTRYHSSPDPRPLRSASPPSTYASKTQMGRKLEEAGHLKSLHFDDLGLDFEEFQGEWASVGHDSLPAVRAGGREGG